MTMELGFCLEALRRALRWGRPEVFNSDQGSQFTSEKFTGDMSKVAIRNEKGSRSVFRLLLLAASLVWEYLNSPPKSPLTRARRED